MRLLRNMQLKILAVVFAMILWFHVATNQRYDLEILYKITFVNMPESLALVEAPPTDVAVHMRGSGKALMRLMWGDRRWPIDLSRAKPGPQQIPILAANVPLYGIQDLEVMGLADHDTVTVILDSLGQKVVPIRSSVEIEADEGFIYTTAPILTPDSTTISGPLANVQRVQEVWTRPEVIQKARSPVERLLPVMPPNSYGVATDVGQVRLYQKVEPYLRREFASVPVHVKTGAITEELAVSPTHVRVEVAGPQSAVVQLAADSIIVSCEPRFLEETQVVVRAAVTVPPHLQVLKLDPDSVTVERRERTRADSGD